METVRGKPLRMSAYFKVERRATNHLQPIESARIPPVALQHPSWIQNHRSTLPRGAPMPAPKAYMIFIIPCHVPLSRNGIISLIIIDTTVLIPPPPMPANACVSCQRPRLYFFSSTHSCSNELVHVPGKAAEEAPNAKDRISEQKRWLSSEYIA